MLHFALQLALVSYPRLLIAGLAVWIASIAVGYVINDLWLARLYQANAWAFRRAADVAPLVPIGLGAQLLGSLAFAWLYAKGYEPNREASGIAQGVRFGLATALLVVGFATVWNYVTQPIAARLGALQMLGIVGELGICGAIVGLIYHPGRIAIPRGAAAKYDLRG
jgi:putative flippase GtrA